MKELRVYNQYTIRILILIGILIAVISSSVVFLNLADVIVLQTAVIAAILSAFVGIISLYHIRIEGLFREDPLHMMRFLFYFGLLIFSCNELAIAAGIFSSDEILIDYIPSIIRTFGMIFWLIGVVNYVRATDKVLNFIGIKVLILQILFCSLSVLFVVAGIYSELSNTVVISTINLIIFSLGAGIMACFIFYLSWIFRKGELRNFLLSVFTFLFFMLIRNIVIAFSTHELFILVSLTLALEVYLCMWISESLFFQLFHT